MVDVARAVLDQAIEDVKSGRHVFACVAYWHAAHKFRFFDIAFPEAFKIFAKARNGNVEPAWFNQAAGDRNARVEAMISFRDALP